MRKQALFAAAMSALASFAQESGAIQIDGNPVHGMMDYPIRVKKGKARRQGKMRKTIESLHRDIARQEANSRLREMRGRYHCRHFPHPVKAKNVKA